MGLRIVTTVRQSNSDYGVVAEINPVNTRQRGNGADGLFNRAGSAAGVPRRRMGGSSGSEVGRLHAEIDELQVRLARSEARLAQVEGRLQRILNSRSYRFARRLASTRRRVASLVGVRGTN
jgi:hypothetical protein